MYFADPSGSRYSPQDQINASNFNQLQQAWHFKTDNLGGRPEFKLEGTPIEVNGTVYTTGGSRHRSDLCCTAEFVTANRPQQEIASPDWASRYQSSSSAELAMNCGWIF